MYFSVRISGKTHCGHHDALSQSLGRLIFNLGADYGKIIEFKMNTGAGETTFEVALSGSGQVNIKEAMFDFALCSLEPVTIKVEELKKSD